MPKAKQAKENDKREFQKKYMQYQIAQQYAAALAEEKAALEAKLAELSMTSASMLSLKKIRQGEEIWSALGSDVFVMSDIKDISTAIVGVGAGVYVRKPLDEAVKTIEARRAELAEAEQQLTAEMAALGEQFARLEPELQAMAAQLQGEEKEAEKK
jgi:prefoldin alpha subunit